MALADSGVGRQPPRRPEEPSRELWAISQAVAIRRRGLVSPANASRPNLNADCGDLPRPAGQSPGRLAGPLRKTHGTPLV